MITSLRINFNFPEIAAELGRVDDVHGIVSDVALSVARLLNLGDTAGDIWQRHRDSESGMWASFRAASFEVVDNDGRAVTNLHEVVE